MRSDVQKDISYEVFERILTKQLFVISNDGTSFILKVTWNNKAYLLKVTLAQINAQNTILARINRNEKHN